MNNIKHIKYKKVVHESIELPIYYLKVHTHIPSGILEPIREYINYIGVINKHGLLKIKINSEQEYVGSTMSKLENIEELIVDLKTNSAYQIIDGFKFRRCYEGIKGSLYLENFLFIK